VVLLTVCRQERDDGGVPEELERYPGPSLRDHARTGFDAAIVSIPGIGGSLQVLIEAVLTPSLTKRRDRWLRKLEELMKELQAKVDGFEPAKLAGDEAFVTAVVDASRIAMGTHLEEKLNLLKNALARMAVSEVRDDFLDLQLFRFVDELSPEHFVVLQYLDNPGAWFDAKNISRPNLAIGSPDNLVGHLMDHAGLPVKGAGLEITLRDLSARGLAKIEDVDPTTSWRSTTTDLGRQLLSFVNGI
jgi:hypothetical protein